MLADVPRAVAGPIFNVENVGTPGGPHVCQPPIDETYMSFELSWNELPAPGEVHVESVKGKVTLGLDLERPYAGHEVDVEASVTLERLGRNLVGPAELEVERASLNRDY